MELSNIETELKKASLQASKAWGGKQVNCKDFATNKVVYSGITDYNKLLKELKVFNLSEDMSKYAVKRWYNFTISEAVKGMFLEWSNARAEADKKHKSIDIYINDIPFDIKGSVFPRKLKFDDSYLSNVDKKTELINWLYDNQSTQGRFHLENRLFVIYYSSIRAADVLKSELLKTKESIDSYMSSFDKQNLIRIGTSVSDIIWVVE